MILFTGCSVSQNLQTNIFQDIWNEFVTDKDTSIGNNRTSVINTQATQDVFTELNNHIDELRQYLIIGEEIMFPEQEEPVFRDGLMNISDQNSEELIDTLRKSLDILDGNTDKVSLNQAVKDMKKNVQKTCLLQKVAVDCSF